MREFTHEERLAAASAVAAHAPAAHLLRPETHRMVAESWAQGEVLYVISNQFAIQLQCELNDARKALTEIVEMKRIDRAITNATLDIVAFPMRRRTVVFTPDEIQAAMDKNLAAGLRQLADEIDAGRIDGKCIDCNGNGFTGGNDVRAHLMLRIDLAAPIRQTFPEGESREEFERDRMGQTGEDNARKMFGDKDKS
jgi:hypothetical protein